METAERNGIGDLFEQFYLFVVSDEDKLQRLIKAHIKKLSVADVAYLLGKSERTIERWINDGKWIMPVSDDGDRRMSVQDFERQFKRVYKTPKR